MILKYVHMRSLKLLINPSIFFSFDVPKLQFHCKASIAELKLDGKYDVKGTVLGAPIVGTGDFKAGIGI